MATFPYTPSFVHGETMTYAVAVHRFADRTEQRYLASRQTGRRLAYEFARPSSETVAGIASWFLGHGGPRDTFTAVDHRTQTAYTVRFAAPTLDHAIVSILPKRSLRVEFIVDQGGTTPVATTYVASAVAEFCDPVVATSGVVGPGEAAARDGWPLIGGPVTVTATNRFLPLTNQGLPSSTRFPVEAALPANVQFIALTMRVLDIGSAGSVRLRFCVNGTERSEISVTASASLVTVVATGTITTSARAGTLACIQSSLFTANLTGAQITYGIGYKS
jgi:hypothetical protein